MDSTRQLKINELLKREISAVFQLKGRNMFGQELISVTEVRITPDLSVAKVYLSIFPTNNRQAIMEAVDKQNSALRFELGNRVKSQLRKIPELHFYLDDTLDQLEKIDNLLKSK
jgi:ribosome-binding factor A